MMQIECNRFQAEIYADFILLVTLLIAHVSKSTFIPHIIERHLFVASLQLKNVPDLTLAVLVGTGGPYSEGVSEAVFLS